MRSALLYPGSICTLSDGFGEGGFIMTINALSHRHLYGSGTPLNPLRVEYASSAQTNSRSNAAWDPRSSSARHAATALAAAAEVINERGLDVDENYAGHRGLL
jgi:hypothetical protein